MAELSGPLQTSRLIHNKVEQVFHTCHFVDSTVVFDLRQVYCDVLSCWAVFIRNVELHGILVAALLITGITYEGI